MNRLCITADDYGMHAVVNEAIEDLAAAGHISAAAIMCHEGAQLDDVDRLRDAGISLGVHLVFTQEQPVLAGLVNTPLAPTGFLPPTPYALARRLIHRPRLRHQLFDELTAQLDRYLDLGLPLDFVNSHEHVHEVPMLWTMVAELLERRGAVAIRSAHVQPITPTGQGALALLSRASWHLRRPQRAQTILSPLGAGQAGRMSAAAIESLVDRGLRWHGGNGAIPELVMHPATEDAPLHAIYGDIVGRRRAEYDLLRSAELRALWRRRDIELVGPSSSTSTGGPRRTTARFRDSR